jgi:hypothetical protein
MFRRVIHVAALSVLLFSPSVASAASPDFCASYATQAIGQYARAVQLGLTNLNWPQWGNHYDGHYGWCLIVDEQTAQSQIDERQSRIDSGQ